MAKPRKRLPATSINIYCKKCRFKLLVYRKGGNGSLIKCFESRITKNFTEEVGVCPNCNGQFSRLTMIRGEPALKIIGGKVLTK